MQILDDAILRERYEVVVIGSGIGGLTAGALLAKRGLQPLVIVGQNPGFGEFNVERGDSWASLQAILPNGNYEIVAREAGLLVSHPFQIDHSLMPPIPNITSPAHGQVITSPPLVVTWDAAPFGVGRVWVWLESSSGVDFVELDVSLDPTETSFEIPSSLLQPGEAYMTGVAFERTGSGINYVSERDIEITIGSP